MPDISITNAVIILAVVAIVLVFRRTLKSLVTPKSDPGSSQKFARLLVAEIKLYNVDKLESAYRTNSIYQELKTEIDNARKLYEERVPREATVGRDYFYEALVNGLAGGDATKLGTGYFESISITTISDKDSGHS